MLETKRNMLIRQTYSHEIKPESTLRAIRFQLLEPLTNLSLTVTGDRAFVNSKIAFRRMQIPFTASGPLNLYALSKPLSCGKLTDLCTVLSKFALTWRWGVNWYTLIG